MANPKINNMLIPNVSRIGGNREAEVNRKTDSTGKSEFDGLLQEQLEGKKTPEQGISLSTHAAKRLKERNLEMDAGEFTKLKGAIEMLRNKGGQDSLVITGKAAYIVDVSNNRIVTAIDRDNMAENVFTKIDSTLFVN
ncbi:MAG: flagellar protein [Bdellovibrionales bacterium CG12_big_fil_rev_8_21_14_0_65_38_15]|nr:MAG: flagellar protein [Bdellovibrionales bacterium CG22_combo_CG10-13_8_21_14_all_38_13]PIQ53599.1 MAG: flagellar protein [Bdellovibrionales bacterium CG12_big_fil_rev_8_21_14_0_65_38_15]PIR28397.1 MAG: flagellar protein [Bdellovibrionales bacterium CG11_big_fil_rev_8_21_14_0_20_38_13]